MSPEDVGQSSERLDAVQRKFNQAWVKIDFLVEDLILQAKDLSSEQAIYLGTQFVVYYHAMLSACEQQHRAEIEVETNPEYKALCQVDLAKCLRGKEEFEKIVSSTRQGHYKPMKEWLIQQAIRDTGLSRSNTKKFKGKISRLVKKIPDERVMPRETPFVLDN